MPPLPSFPVIEAGPGWRAIDFISDLHLWQQSPRTFEAWARYMKSSAADAIFILGDLFEVWLGDDARGEPFEASCVRVLREAAATRSIFFLHGNRDFLVGNDMLHDSAVSLMSDPTVLSAFGQRVLLSHGDELCLSDLAYQQWRVVARNPQGQAQFLKMPLEHRRAYVRKLRDDSEQRKAAGSSVEKWVDLDLPAASSWMEAAEASVFVHGHTHMPGSENLAAGRKRIVLSDWDLDGAESSVPRSEIMRMTAGGFERLSIDAALR